MWRGYRDCIDVDVLPHSLPVANTSGAMYGYKGSPLDSWIRIDHAQVPKGGYNLYKHKANCAKGRPAYKFQSCFVLPPEGEVIIHPKDGYSNSVHILNPGLPNNAWTREYALARCKQRCSNQRFSSCQGVQVVPLTPPPSVAFNTTEDQNIPWDEGDCRYSDCRYYIFDHISNPKRLPSYS